MARFGTANRLGCKLEPGTYKVKLLGFVDKKMRRGEQFSDASKGQHADDMLDKVEWVFEVDGVEEGELTYLTSPSVNKKAGFFVAASALNGGEPPCDHGDASFDWERLLGRWAKAKVINNQAGFSKIETLMPVPLEDQDIIRPGQAPRGSTAAEGEADLDDSIPF